MAETTSKTNSAAIATPCTCRNGVAGRTGNHALPAENGDPSAAAGSAEAEEVTDGQGKPMEVDQDKAMGTHSSAKTISPDASSSPIASKTPALARLTSPAMRISDKLTPARAAFAVLTLLALWFTADQPRRVVWTFSAIAISYITLWTIWLTAAIQARTVLISVSYVALVAISITHLSSAMGIFVLLLDTAYSAGLCGYALSEYRQRKGFERAAEALRTRSKEELKADRAVIAIVSFYSTVTSLVCTAGAAWVIYYVVDTYWVVVVLSLLIDLSLFCWTAPVTVHLWHGALPADDYITFIYWGVALLFVPDFLLSYLFGNAIGMLVHPLGVMGIAGLLGYNLGQVLEVDDGKNK